MKNLIFIVFTFTLITACNKDKGEQIISEENPSSIKESKREITNENSTNEVKDNFVGTWKNISVQDEIVEVTKKYDNVYQFGTLEVFKEYAEDGTIYLQGTFDNQIEFQLIFDNHTQHLIVRHPFDTREYSKVQ